MPQVVKAKIGDTGSASCPFPRQANVRWHLLIAAWKNQVSADLPDLSMPAHQL